MQSRTPRHIRSNASFAIVSVVRSLGMPILRRGAVDSVDTPDHVPRELLVVVNAEAPVLAISCTRDLDGDGDVDPSDLAILLGGWGSNPGHPADLDGDGVIGPIDLASLLGSWGECE